MDINDCTFPAAEALKNLDWVVQEMWKHTTHGEHYCDAELLGDPLHISAKWSCDKLISNEWVVNAHKKTVFWVGEEGDTKRRTVDADLDEDQELMFCSVQILKQIDSSIDTQTCWDAFVSEHCE